MKYTIKGGEDQRKLSVQMAHENSGKIKLQSPLVGTWSDLPQRRTAAKLLEKDRS
jgi:hypothetical protein